ncbi:terminase gpA endonuclease subunit [Aurantimonas sp. C2-6-R+9]|uniref:terminase gpA endonuclease subunit n=1 Tax=Aurantimonas sp. C2-6-R+9 TaxID=3114365 RepID=UPI002E1839A5|nr:terminase gpA endonuclease subunit [Aurantimonas sp. C2-6-R+9]
MKGQLASRLTRGRTVRFSDRLEGRFYEELASERLIVRYIRGAPARLWERIPGRRAESLDCVIYGMAVRNLVTANLDRREEEVASATMPKKAPAVVKSAWLNR